MVTPWHYQNLSHIPLNGTYVFWQSCPSWQASSPLVDGIKRWTSGLADTDQSTEFPVETTLKGQFGKNIKTQRNHISIIFLILLKSYFYFKRAIVASWNLTKLLKMVHADLTVQYLWLSITILTIKLIFFFFTF